MNTISEIEIYQSLDGRTEVQVTFVNETVFKTLYPNEAIKNMDGQE